MRSIAPEFLPHSAPSKRVWVGAGAVVVSALASLWLAFEEREARLVAERVIQAQVSDRSRQIVEVKQSPPPVYMASALAMLKERSLPWSSAMRVIEATPSDGVTPQSLEVDSTDGVIRLEVSARNHATLMTYMEALNAGVDAGQDDLSWSIVSTRSTPASSDITAQLKAWRQRLR